MRTKQFTAIECDNSDIDTMFIFCISTIILYTYTKRAVYTY